MPEGFSFAGQSASGQSRQHNGNVYNYYPPNYSKAEQRSDDALGVHGRNEQLLQAAKEGQTPRVKHLLDKGAELDYQGEYGLTALHQAVLSGFEDVVIVLLEIGADINVTSAKLGTPLCLAILKSRQNIATLLLQKRASVHTVTKTLGTALHCAAWKGDLATVQVLLDAKAKPTTEAEVDISCLEWIVYRFECPEERLSFQQSDMLSCSKCTPLFLAVYGGDLSCVKLLRLCSLVSCTDFFQCRYIFTAPRSSTATETKGPPEICSTLMVAAERRGLEVLKYLIKTNHFIGEQQRDRAYAEIAAAAESSDRAQRHLIAMKLELEFMRKRYENNLGDDLLPRSKTPDASTISSQTMRKPGNMLGHPGGQPALSAKAQVESFEDMVARMMTAVTQDISAQVKQMIEGAEAKMKARQSATIVQKMANARDDLHENAFNPIRNIK